MINLQKSGLVCGKGLDSGLKIRLASILNVPFWDSPDTYLGVPVEWGRSKSHSLKWIMEKVTSRLVGWKGNLLTQAWKGVLIKAIIQDISTYVMSILRLPKDFRKKISSAVTNFWCSSKVGSKGIHWKNWSSMCTHKNFGGMGFKDFNHMNSSLLTKQA